MSYRHHKAWRKRRPDLRNAGRARNYERGCAHLSLAERRAKRPWSRADEAKVLLHLIPDRELAMLIRRSVRAIQIRRSILRRRAQTL